MQFTVNRVALNLTAGYAVKAGEKINIRAKTLQVLQYLINHQEQIVTKEALLNTVWSDVVVQEQVLVQSIKEIRALLGSDCIKTYPKKGYQWVADIEIIKSKQRRNRLLFAAVSILVAILCVSYLMIRQSDAPSPHLTMAFLPVENAIPDAVHDWLPTKGSQQLHDLMASYKQVKVISAEQRDDYKAKKDVDVLVYTRLHGYPDDFQLDYTLFLPHGEERGVEFGSSIDDIFIRFTEQLANRFDINTQENGTASIKSNFKYEALSRGIELYYYREYEAAASLFKSALHDNEDFLIARRMLAASKVNANQQTLGKTLLEENIVKAVEQQNYKEQIRSQLLLAALIINGQPQPNFLEAEQHLLQVVALTKAHDELLFLAYAYEELGKIKRLQQQYQEAKSYLNDALTYHQTIVNNYSQTTALIELALVASAEQKEKLSQQYFESAEKIADQHGAATNKVAILMAKAYRDKQLGKVDESTKYAQQAMAIAKQANNALWQARISAWLAERHYYEMH